MRRIAQLRDRFDELQSASLDVLIVFCQKPRNVAAWLAKHPLPFPILVDDDRSRAKRWGVYTLISYDGINIARPAAFVVDPAGKLQYARVSRHQMDHAPFKEILEAARRQPEESMDIRESYDSAAAAYAEHLSDELAHKPLDRHLLNRFAEATRDRGLVADLGCGPGHVAKYLSQQGVRIVGVDFAPKMVAVARNLNPDLDFRVEDMRHLNTSNASLAGVVMFYSIVHFDLTELPAVFREARRVLVPGALALVAFHIGEEVVHRDDLFGAPVSLDFRCHVPERVVETLRSANLAVIERIEREPYEGAEYPSRRCYLVARAD